MGRKNNSEASLLKLGGRAASNFEMNADAPTRPIAAFSFVFGGKSYITFCIEQPEPHTVNRGLGMPRHLRLEDRIPAYPKSWLRRRTKSFSVSRLN